MKEVSGDYIMVMVTASNEAEASRIGKTVVTERLAACCNILPGFRSIYRWKGELMNEPEALCIFKTRASLFTSLKDRVVELHSYEVPEVVSIEIKAGHSDYLAWITENTTL
ncbi:MAG: divalent-cation tolerance protein CutA [Thermodesulfobacteriota bacterium]